MSVSSVGNNSIGNSSGTDSSSSSPSSVDQSPSSKKRKRKRLARLAQLTLVVNGNNSDTSMEPSLGAGSSSRESSPLTSSSEASIAAAAAASVSGLDNSPGVTVSGPYISLRCACLEFPKKHRVMYEEFKSLLDENGLFLKKRLGSGVSSEAFLTQNNHVINVYKVKQFIDFQDVFPVSLDGGEDRRSLVLAFKRIASDDMFATPLALIVFNTNSNCLEYISKEESDQLGTEHVIYAQVTKFVSGTTLYDQLEGRKQQMLPLSSRVEKAQYFSAELEEKKYDYFSTVLQVADMIEALLDQDVLHRDLNLGNLIEKPDGRLMLIDWGTAIQMSVGPKSPVGALVQRAPEATTRQAYGEESAIFALGAIMYQIVFAGESKEDGTGSGFFARINYDPKQDVLINSLKGHQQLKKFFYGTLNSDPKQRISLEEAKQLLRSI